MSLRFIMEVWGEHEEIEHEHAILGQCHGVLFQRRGRNDPHVCVLPITEDDGNWFVSRSELGMSSAWMQEYIQLMGTALQWLTENCDRDGNYGYKFRD